MRSIFFAAFVGAFSFPATADELRLAADSTGIGPGSSQTQPLVYADNTLRLTFSPASQDITLSSPAGASPNWSLDLKGLNDQPIETLCYERATRAAFAAANRPGVDFGFSGSGCNNVRGRYRVLELQRDPGGVPTAIAVDFVQHCENRGGAVYGQVRWRSSVPTVAGETMDPVVEVDGNWMFTAEQGAVGHGTNNGGVPIARSIALDHPQIIGSTGSDNGVSFSFSGPVTGIQSNVNASISFAAPDDAPVTPGAYPNATRFPFQAAGIPGFAMTFNGSGCGDLVGGFTVAQATFDALDRFPLTLRASFEQRCSNAAGPLTQGTFDYQARAYAVIADPVVITRTGFEDNEPATSLARGCTR